MVGRKSKVGLDEFWLTKDSKIAHIVSVHNVWISDSWIANIASIDGTFEHSVEIYGYDLTERISISEVEVRLEAAQTIREKKARARIAKFLKMV